jgi:hypothetical protein
MKRTPKYSVFFSYSAADREAAGIIERALAGAGLDVFDPASVDLGQSVADAIWQALALSDAVVVLMPPDGSPTPNTAAELGAALAWRKPIYVVSKDNGRVRAPSFLRGHVIYPASRIEDVARAIKEGPKPLSEDEIEALKTAYLELNTPTDRLIQDPALLDLLAQRFNSKTRSKVPGERLIYEMIRLRKQGRWPRLRPAPETKTRA